MHLEQEPRRRRQRRLVVLHAGAVGGADLDERAARLAHHVGDAETAADLHQLAAGDDDLFPRGERAQREHRGRRAVVDDERVLRARESAEQLDDVRKPTPPLPFIEVELEVAVPTRDRGDPLDRPLRERRTAQVRVLSVCGRNEA
jgi:hypothetical protein